MLPISLHPLAAVEISEAVAFYEAAAPGKGLELADRLEAALARLRDVPEASPVTRGRVRSCVVQPSSRWSYTLHYRVLANRLRVLALAHHKRQPFYWFGRR